jgi:S1-C subfamily serine protease
MIRFACPHCDSAIQLNDDQAGQKTNCPECGEQVEVPNRRNATMSDVSLPDEPPIEPLRPRAPILRPLTPKKTRRSNHPVRVQKAAEDENDQANVETVSGKSVRRKPRSKSARGRQLALAVCGVAGGVFVAMALAAFLTSEPSPEVASTTASTLTSPSTLGTGQSGETQPRITAPKAPTPTVLFSQVAPAIVEVAIKDRKNAIIGTGAGFLVSDTGLVVTNYHVIEKAHDSHITFADQSGPVVEGVRVEGVAALDKAADLAIIKLAGDTKRRPLQLAGSALPPVGTKVYAIGSTPGVAKSLGEGQVSGHGDIDRIKVIQTTIAIRSESSGGPLLGPDGRVVGVATFNRKGGESLAFAVPASRVAALLELAESTAQLTKLPLGPTDAIAVVVERVKPQLRAGKLYTIDELTQLIGRPRTSSQATTSLISTGKPVIAASSGDIIPSPMRKRS